MVATIKLMALKIITIEYFNKKLLCLVNWVILEIGKMIFYIKYTVNSRCLEFAHLIFREKRRNEGLKNSTSNVPLKIPLILGL